MINFDSLPPQVLVKIATLEQGCITLGATLEAARRDLTRLRIERQNCVPGVAYDEMGVNEESERVLGEWKRLDAAIATQATRCEALERRLRAEEAVVKACKHFLHELSPHARLRDVSGEQDGAVAPPTDLDAIRARIGEVRDEIEALQRTPVPSADLEMRIAHYVDQLAAKGQPIVQGIGAGQALRVLFPLTDSADRITQSYFTEAQANPLLLAALLDGERLRERLLACALDGSITAAMRDQQLHSLQAEATALRYAEEASICAANARGDDVSRSSTPPAWAVLQIEVESRDAQVAA